MRRDEEQYFRALLGREFSFEQITKNGDGRYAWCPLSCLTLRIGEHTTHDGSATIWNEDFRLHALCIYAWYTTDGNTGVDCVVLNRDS
jgi:hypothetical protein